MLLFAGGTIFTNLLGWQVTPFFVWGMYSEKERDINQYSVYRVTINDSLEVDFTSGLSDGNRFFLTSPLSLYTQIKSNGGNDPTKLFLQDKLKQIFLCVEKTSFKVLNGKKEYELFLPWYKRYLEHTLDMPIRNFTVEIMNVKYDEQNKLKVYSTALIDKWQ